MKNLLLLIALLLPACATRQPGSMPSPANIAFNDAMRNASQGQVILTPFDSAAHIPVLPIQIKPASTQPQLLLSDKPEYFRTGDGIAMQERVEPGLVRLYVYHVPVPRTDQEPVGKRIVAVIDNLGSSPLSLTMKRSALAPVGGFYQKMARGVMERFVDDVLPNNPPVTTIDRRGEIDPALSTVVDAKDLLVHGWYEFTIDQPARITVAQIGAEDAIDAIDTLPKLPRVLPGQHASGAGRGLFPTSEFVVTNGASAPVYDMRAGIAQVLIADGVRDPWMTGRDSISPDEPDPNQGNYGAIYQLKLKARGAKGQSLAVLVASDRKDSQWCGATSLAVHVNDGTFPGGVVRAPAEKPIFKAMPDAVLLQTYDFPESEKPIDVEITYTPPGASCLPTPILLVPFER